SIGSIKSLSSPLPGCTGASRLPLETSEKSIFLSSSRRIVVFSRLVIVRDFDIMRVAAFPTKTCTPLVVNADAPLPFPIPRQFLQSVTRRDAQILDCLCSVDRLKLAPSYVL